MAITEPTSRAAAWGDSGTYLTEPSESLQHSGFVPGQKPNRERLNWLLNWLDNAAQWLISYAATNVLSSVTADGTNIECTKATKISLGGATALLITMSGDGTHVVGGFSVAEALWPYLPGSYSFTSVTSTASTDASTYATISDVAHGMNFTIGGVGGGYWNLHLLIFTVP